MNGALSGSLSASLSTWLSITQSSGVLAPLAFATIALPLAIAAACLPAATRRTAVALAPWAAFPALVLALTAPDGVLIDLPWALLGMQLGLQPITRLFLLFGPCCGWPVANLRMAT
jgi:hypothetical protein